MVSLAAQPAEKQVQSTADEDGSHVGIVTRVLAWGVDMVLINLVVIVVGLGVALVTSVFHLSSHHKTTWKVIAGVVYVLWVGGYFIVFWTTTGQTPGARFMQIRLVNPKRDRVHPVRAFVRLIGMELAALTLFAGYLPILFERRALPDWLAKTLVIDASQTSIAKLRQEALKAARENGPGGTPGSRIDEVADLPDRD